MKKAIGRMNKGELFEFAKEMKDVLKGKNMTIVMLEGESQEKEIQISKYLETIRFLRDEIAVMQKLLTQHRIKTEKVIKEKPFPKRKSKGWRNLFGLFS